MARKSRGRSRSGRLFSEPQGEFFEKSAEEVARRRLPVECLGITFDSEAARRDYFLEKLRDKLADLEFRSTPGFPRAKDEDILRLSDPPYYTACPNPFLEDFVRAYGRSFSKEEEYQREPLAADVSAGKNDPVYTAHSYHTKVPHRAIVEYILHYTSPGDVVLDPYCGSGMTGVAALRCGEAPHLGSPVIQEAAASAPQAAMPSAAAGSRIPILADLAPAATFLSAVYTQDLDSAAYEAATAEVLRRVHARVGWMYETEHTGRQKAQGTVRVEPVDRKEVERGQIDYTIWSDVLVCPDCSAEFVYWDVALDAAAGKALSTFKCPGCDAEVDKRTAIKARETVFDPVLGEARTRGKREPVLVVYSLRGKRYEKPADGRDRKTLETIEATAPECWVPCERVLSLEGRWGDQWREGYHFDVSHAHDFYTSRNLRACAVLLDEVQRADVEESVRRALLFAFTGITRSVSRLASIAFSYYFKGGGGAINAGTKGTLYIASVVPEINPLEAFASRARAVARASHSVAGPRAISTSSAERLGLPDRCVDYAFIDPPFGDNLAYSELNFLWESWLRVFTVQDREAIVSKFQGKTGSDFREMIRAGLAEVFRVLKPGRWLTVEFHNSSNSIWNAIQEAIGSAGFVVADVRVLDKRQGSYNQYVARGAVNKDLVISAYRPHEALERNFALERGSSTTSWSFVSEHLGNLPVWTRSDVGVAELNPERQKELLFDRMVAFHVQRGATVPVSAKEFYSGLSERFPERDGMYFLPDQVVEYDRKRSSASELRQLSLFISDEASAIQWVRQALQGKPQSFQDLQPQFMKELQAWARHERTVELKQILAENFLCYEDGGPVPAQIHSYLSTNFKDCRNLEKTDHLLVEKARNRWYVPDPAKQGDLEQIRSRRLLAEFEDYTSAPKKKLKRFRTEAIRAGFRAAWNAKDFQAIVDVAERIPDSVLQEDADLLMYYDNATTLLGKD